MGDMNSENEYEVKEAIGGQDEVSVAEHGDRVRGRITRPVAVFECPKRAEHDELSRSP